MCTGKQFDICIKIRFLTVILDVSVWDENNSLFELGIHAIYLMYAWDVCPVALLQELQDVCGRQKKTLIGHKMCIIWWNAC